MALRVSENGIRGVDPLLVWVAVGTTRTARPIAPKQIERSQLISC